MTIASSELKWLHQFTCSQLVRRGPSCQELTQTDPWCHMVPLHECVLPVDRLKPWQPCHHHLWTKTQKVLKVYWKFAQQFKMPSTSVQGPIDLHLEKDLGWPDWCRRPKRECKTKITLLFTQSPTIRAAQKNVQPQYKLACQVSPCQSLLQYFPAIKIGRKIKARRWSHSEWLSSACRRVSRNVDVVSGNKRLRVRMLNLCANSISWCQMEKESRWYSHTVTKTKCLTTKKILIIPDMDKIHQLSFWSMISQCQSLLRACLFLANFSAGRSTHPASDPS